ncbi:hypothetical protein LSTR_LSTR015352 [Laodelphax striatellus]|uniref:lysozyme n=1 Tax=Laodelphax striatellus TaxID=195883 RepID=A0A482X6Q7_LAOST|nr:hypothetical protein LSTR_LSTR015352 [Laodelphax striatellus]
MASSILLVLTLAAYCSNVFANHLTDCPEADKQDCPCLEKLRRAMVDCYKNPGCIDGVCGPYRIIPQYYAGCHCPTINGRCLKPELCDEECPEFKKNFVECTNNQHCAQRCVTAYQKRYEKQIKKCRGETDCARKLHAHVLGPFNCTGEIHPTFLKRFNSADLCPCETYEK